MGKKKNTPLLLMIDFIKQYEGFRDTVYEDTKGNKTIGYGFTDPDLIAKGRISRAEADEILGQKIQSRLDVLSGRVKNWDKLSNDSKTALLSYYYNYPAGFKDTTKFMNYWNSGDYDRAIGEVDAGMNDESSPGLRTRRLVEQALLRNDPFLSAGAAVVNESLNGNRTMTFSPGFWGENIPTPAGKNVWEYMEQNAPKYDNSLRVKPTNINTQYPLNNTVPQSINSWNGAGSPAQTVRTPGLIDTLENSQREVEDVFNKAANAWGAGPVAQLPSTREVMRDWGKDYVKDVLFSNPFYDNELLDYIPLKAKGGKDLPKFKDGKRYIKDYDGTWNRITDDDNTDVFSRLVVTPKGAKTNPKRLTEDEILNAVYGEKPVEKGLENPMIDPFLLLVGGGRFSGDIVGDAIGEVVGNAASNVASTVMKPVYNKLNSLYHKKLQNQANRVKSSNAPFYVFHGTPTKKINSSELRNYSDHDIGLHVSEDNQVARQFASERDAATWKLPYSSVGDVHEGIDYTIYPDGLYGDLGNWSAPTWNMESMRKFDGFKDTGRVLARNVDENNASVAETVRDIAKAYGLDENEFTVFAHMLRDAEQTGTAQDVLNVLKQFANYLRDHGVNFKYINFMEGAESRAAKYPSSFLADPSDVHWTKKIYYSPEISNVPEKTAFIDWNTGKLKFPDLNDTYPVNIPYAEDRRLFGNTTQVASQKIAPPIAPLSVGTDFDVDLIGTPVLSTGILPVPFPPATLSNAPHPPVYDVTKDPYIGTFRRGKDLPRFKDGDDAVEGAKIGADAINKLLAGLSLDAAQKLVVPFINSYIDSEGFKQRFERTKEKEFKRYVNSKYDRHKDFEYGRSYTEPNKSDVKNTKVNKADAGWEDNGYFVPWNVYIGNLTGRDYDTVLAHELGHAMDASIFANTGEKYSETLPTLRQNKLYLKDLGDMLKSGREEYVKKWLEDPYNFDYDGVHDALPGESYGDLVATRYWLNKVGIFDSRKKDELFTKDHYNKVKGMDMPFNVKRFFDNFDEDSYIDAVNNIAQNDTNKKPSTLMRAKTGKNLLSFYRGKTPQTTSGAYMPNPFYNAALTPPNAASRYIEEYADLVPFLGSVMEWDKVSDGDYANVPSAAISTVADMFLPSVVKGYKKAGAISRLAKSTGRKTKQMIDNAYKEVKEGVKEFKSALAYQLAGAWEDILDHTK